MVGGGAHAALGSQDGGYSLRLRQALATVTHPTDAFGGHADHERAIKDIPSDHRARADESIASDCGTADDRGVGTYAGPALDQGWPVLILASHRRTRIDNVCEHAARATENVVFESDAVVDANVILNAHTAANDDIGDVATLADDAITTNDSAGTHVRKVPDLATCTDLRPFVNNGGGVNVVAGFGHSAYAAAVYAQAST